MVDAERIGVDRHLEVTDGGVRRRGNGGTRMVEKDAALASRWRADGAVEVGKVEPGPSADGGWRCGRTARHAALVPSAVAPRKRGRDPGRKRRLRGERGRDRGRKRRAEPLAAAGWHRWLPSPGDAWWLPLLRSPLRAEHPVWREPDLETGRVGKTDLETDVVPLRVPPPPTAPTAPESIGLPVPKPTRGDRRPTEEPSGCVARPDVVAQEFP